MELENPEIESNNRGCFYLHNMKIQSINWWLGLYVEGVKSLDAGSFKSLDFVNLYHLGLKL